MRRMTEAEIQIAHRTCGDCGMLMDRTGEFHPYSFCVWAKAGLEPWDTLNDILEGLGRERVRRGMLVSWLRHQEGAAGWEPA